MKIVLSFLLLIGIYASCYAQGDTHSVGNKTSCTLIIEYEYFSGEYDNFQLPPGSSYDFEGAGEMEYLKIDVDGVGPYDLTWVMAQGVPPQTTSTCNGNNVTLSPAQFTNQNNTNHYTVGVY